MIVLYCFLILKVFMRITLGYFLKTFLLISKKMGCCFPSSRNKASIEVIDVIDLSKHFVYLRPSGKLVYKVDDIYNLLRVDIYFDGWYPNSVCLWPKDNSARQHILMIERTPPTCPQLSSFEAHEGDVECAVDTIHYFFYFEQKKKRMDKKHKK